MTIEERFERIEHVTAGLAEERRKDREEFRGLWRDTQRHLNDLTVQVAELGDRIHVLAEESRAADKRLEERIESMVSAMGAFITKMQEGRA